MNQSGKHMQPNSYKPTNHRISIQHKKKCELKPMYSFNDEEIPLTIKAHRVYVTLITLYTKGQTRLYRQK